MFRQIISSKHDTFQTMKENPWQFQEPIMRSKPSGSQEPRGDLASVYYYA